MGTLRGRVAVVAGATRGAGRGIARALGEAGATVYCTGRSVRGAPSPYGRRETIEETADMVSAAGGIAIPCRVDHAVETEVVALVERVERDVIGRSSAGEARQQDQQKPERSRGACRQPACNHESALARGVGHTVRCVRTALDPSQGQSGKQIPRAGVTQRKLCNTALGPPPRGPPSFPPPCPSLRQ